MSIILTESFELQKGKHLYVFDLAGFAEKDKTGDKTRDRTGDRTGDETVDELEERSPLFFVDQQPLTLDDALKDVSDSCAYLVCGCTDYHRRQEQFDNGDSYKRLLNGAKNDWGYVATCSHIILLKRNFVRPWLDKVLETIAQNETNLNLIRTKFLESREAQLFPQLAVRYIANYQTK